MENKRIQIDNLHIKVPGLNKEEAHKLGQNVSRRVAEDLPSNVKSGHLDSLNLNVSIPTDTGTNHLTSFITEAIIKSVS